MAEKKSRILYIKRYLEEYADELHPVTVSDILTHLESVGIETSRHSVMREIEQLIESGADVVCNKGKPNQYFVGDRHFEMPELKLLVDAVMASRFIPPRKVDTLIKKLSQLSSTHQSVELHRSLYTDKQTRPVSDKAYITVDMLYTAESTGKKIVCKYFEYGADKKKVYRHNRRDYRFSPYGLVWNNDRYYTVGWSDDHKKIITLRVDRIAAPKLIEEPAVPKPDDFDMAYYAESIIQMYGGDIRDITLHCDNDMMKHIIDRFGEDVKTEIINTDRFAAYVRIPASPTFYAWTFTFEGAIRIAAPDDIAACYRKMLMAALGDLG
jgi:predicted DNA-binding transcriptional regulator YafY